MGIEEKYRKFKEERWTLMDSKQCVLNFVIIEGDKFLKRLYCKKCGLLIFGKGSLLRMETWVDRCVCVSNEIETKENVRIYVCGCLMIWGEE